MKTEHDMSDATETTTFEFEPIELDELPRFEVLMQTEYQGPSNPVG
jgi:hypothetical protein